MESVEKASSGKERRSGECCTKESERPRKGEAQPAESSKNTLLQTRRITHKIGKTPMAET